MQSTASTVVVLGTGGTIAGRADTAADAVGYQAAQLGARQLIEAIPALAGRPIEVLQVAQLDSKDMDFATWRLLAERVSEQLGRPEVQGIVVTHGTDTLEETAYLLQRVLAPGKPVVMVSAMRPATSLQADGPQNLLDAVAVARAKGARGVVAVIAGRVWNGLELRKVHPYRLNAFDGGDAGPIAQVEAGRLRQHRAWPGEDATDQTDSRSGGGDRSGIDTEALTSVATVSGSGVQAEAFGLGRLPTRNELWPWVEIVTSHAGARATGVQALCAAGVDGLVVAATGNGTLHHALEAALVQARDAGIPVLRCTRCLNGAVIDPLPALPGSLPSAGALTPVQARIELLLGLLASRAGSGAT